MTLRTVPVAVALALAASSVGAMDPPAASAPGAANAASAPRASKPDPRLRSPQESRDSATVPGDLRPERQVTPQISVPLGKSPPAALKLPARNVPRGSAAPTGGIDDAAARCEAQAAESARADCRAKLARPSPSR